MPQPKNGILLAAAAILLWSASSPTTILTGQQIGPWQFLALTCLVAGLAQILLYRLLKMPLKNILLPPLKLWLLILMTFVLYLVVYTLALVWATKPQKVGVNLANYLWPTLTIILAAFLIPGTKFSARLLLALLLALAGLLLANLESLRQLLAQSSSLPLLPYLLGLLAAISWALYSVLLARWKSWSHQYATSPLGFLLTSLLAFFICLLTHTWTPISTSALFGTLFMGLGPQAAAYLLWELSLHRTPAHTLALLASATPILSTLWILLIYPFLGGPASPPNYLHCLLAAALITLAILVGKAKSRFPSPPPQS